MYNTLLFEKKENIGRITLNRPAVMNSLNHEIMYELLEVLNICAESEDVRAIVITGMGKVFSAGGDLKWMRAAQGENWESELGKLVDILHIVIERMRAIEKPIIAAVNGFASGAGFSLALACDIRIATTETKFNQAYIKIGLTPDGGSTYFLTKMLGAARAADLIFTGRVLDAEEALNLGLVNKVVPVQSFAEETEKIASIYANGPTLAFGRAKALINSASVNNLGSQLNMEKEKLLSGSLTADFQEGLDAFLEKERLISGGGSHYCKKRKA